MMSSCRGLVFHFRSRMLATAALLVLASGVGYYLFVRFQIGYLIIGGPDLTPVLDLSRGSYPSLVHMLVLNWLALALSGLKRGLQISGLLLVLSVFAEFTVGYFSLLDTLMLIAGFVTGALTGVFYLRDVPAASFTVDSKITSGLLVAASTVFITGTAPYTDNGVSNARPVYLSYQELRSSITVSEPRPLADVNRVYVYQSTVLLNSENEGIHVIDNSDPSDPQNVAFIEIPGNTELSIRNNFLYADSYVDLVTLNLNDPMNVFEVDREEQVFPYDAYQVIPDDVYFGFEAIDESRGVVIGYEISGRVQ